MIVAFLTLIPKTLIVFLGVVFSKKYTNPSSDIITVIAGLDEVDAVMSDFANAIEHQLKSGASGELCNTGQGRLYVLTGIDQLSFAGSLWTLLWH